MEKKLKQQIDWSESFLLEHLPQIGELDWLEFKRREIISFETDEHKNKANLAKEISSIANSGGGYLVLGIDNDTKKILEGGIPIDIKGGTKEWLMNILPTLVDPPLKEFRVIEIVGNELGSTIESGKAVYVVDIDDSTIAPHQSVLDNKYYHRSGCRSLPSNNRIIMDIAGRQKYPSLKVMLNYGFVNISNPNRLLREGERRILIITIENIGRVFAKYVNVICLIPKYLCNEGFILSNDVPIVEKDHREFARIVRENVITETKSFDGVILTRNPGRYVPLLPGSNHSFSIPLSDNFESHKFNFVKENPIIYWELYADNMPKMSESLSMNKINVDYDLPFD